MFRKFMTRRFAAALAVLVMVISVPLGQPAFSNPSNVGVYVVLNSPELFSSIDSSPAPGAGTEVTFQALDAASGALVSQATAMTEGGVAYATLDVQDGSYKIRVTAQGYQESWYTVSSGIDTSVFQEFLTLQARDTVDSADVIVVDSITPANASWNMDGWTVLHPTASSISGGVATDSGAQPGTLLDDVVVDLFDAAAALGAAPVRTAVTQGGYYTFENQAPGSYKIRFTHGTSERWWPETEHRAEAETITLDGASNFDLAYAIFRPAVEIDTTRTLALSGQPALGATVSAAPDFVDQSGLQEDCLQRYTWFLDGQRVEGAFGPTFVIPLDAGGKTVSARLDVAGLACTYTALTGNSIGPVDPGLTLPGDGVIAAPVDNTGAAPATLTFGSVSEAGTTTVTRLEAAEAPPAGSFSSLTDPPLYYDIETTAVFSEILGVEVCITFDTTGMTAEQAAGQHLYHYVNDAWEDITMSSSTGKVCGLTNSFSPFAVGQPHWPFNGFYEPVNSSPGVSNTVKAGAVVPIRFSVGGDRGLDILATGSPSSSLVRCSDTSVSEAVEQTVAAGSSSLTYAAGADTYSYNWKTQKEWAGTCRQFVLELDDGTKHTTIFDFRK